MYVGIEILAFNVLLRIKSEQQVIAIFFVHVPITLKYPLETSFSIRNILFVSACLNCNKIFLIQKHAFNGLLQVISIQRLFCSEKLVLNAIIKAFW